MARAGSGATPPAGGAGRDRSAGAGVAGNASSPSARTRTLLRARPGRARSGTSTHCAALPRRPLPSARTATPPGGAPAAPRGPCGRSGRCAGRAPGIGARFISTRSLNSPTALPSSSSTTPTRSKAAASCPGRGLEREPRDVDTRRGHHQVALAPAHEVRGELHRKGAQGIGGTGRSAEPARLLLPRSRPALSPRAAECRPRSSRSRCARGGPKLPRTRTSIRWKRPSRGFSRGSNPSRYRQPRCRRGRAASRRRGRCG